MKASLERCKARGFTTRVSLRRDLIIRAFADHLGTILFSIMVGALVGILYAVTTTWTHLNVVEQRVFETQKTLATIGGEVCKTLNMLVEALQHLEGSVQRTGENATQA